MSTVKHNTSSQYEPLLVCAADHYVVPGPDKNGNYANTFQKAGYARQQRNPKGFLRLAKKQHRNLCKIFTKVAGVAPIHIPTKEGLYDAVFTSDPFITITVPRGDGFKRLIIPSKFTNEGRAPEVPHTLEFLKRLYPDAEVITPEHNIEGSGDNTYDTYRGCYWSGFVSDDNKDDAAAGRSHKEAHAFLQEKTGIPVHSIELIKPFFHIDTILCPLPNGHIMVYPKGMTPESYEYFKKAAFEDYGLDPKDYLIEVSKEEAYDYACNARGIGNNVILPKASKPFWHPSSLLTAFSKTKKTILERLKEAGYTPHTVDLSCFLNSGGGVKCLSHNIGLVHVNGGTSGIEHPMPEHAIAA